MLYFSNKSNSNSSQENQPKVKVINPYFGNFDDFEIEFKNTIEEIARDRSLNKINNFNVILPNVNQQYQIILEIEKIKYRIDSRKRLLKLSDLFTKLRFPFELRLVLNGEQAIQKEEYDILNKILSSKSSFGLVDITINQQDNQYDWNLIELLIGKQIGTLVLRIDKFCQQSLRSLVLNKNKIRILQKAKFILQEDVPQKLFDLFAWPSKIQLEVEEKLHPSSTLKLQFLSTLKYISQLDIKYIDNTNYSTTKIVLPILTDQLTQVQKVDRVSLLYEERFSSSLLPSTLKRIQSTNSELDFSLFLPYERFLKQSLKSEKFHAEKGFFQQLSSKSLLEISLSITVNQSVQLFEMFQRQISFVKLSIKIIPNQYNLYPSIFSNQKEDDENLTKILSKYQLSGVCIKNLTLESEKSLSYDNRQTYYNRFAIICIHILGCKVTKLNLSIQEITESDLEKLAKKISMNSQLKYFNIQLFSKLTFNNPTIMHLANSQIQSMSCSVCEKNYQFFYELFLNIKSLQALHIKIDQVPQISEKFYTLSIPYIYLQLNQPINYKQKMMIFSNKNYFLYFNPTEGSKRTIFTHLYFNNLSQILSLNAIYKKCIYSSEKSIYQASLLELLSL